MSNRDVRWGGYYFDESEVPDIIMAYLREQKARPPKEIDPFWKPGDGFQTSWPPRELIVDGIYDGCVIGSEIVALTSDYFQNFDNAFHGIRGLDSVWKTPLGDGYAASIAGGRGFGAMDATHRPDDDACFIVNDSSEAGLRNHLAGFYFISRPNCLVIGEDVFRVLDALGFIASDRSLRVDAVSSKTGERVGCMYLFDPEVRTDIIDLERSGAMWFELLDNKWAALPSFGASLTSFLPDKTISIVRGLAGRGAFLCSKDLHHTLRRHGVRMSKLNGHKAYFNHEYTPVDLLKGVTL